MIFHVFFFELTYKTYKLMVGKELWTILPHRTASVQSY